MKVDLWKSALSEHFNHAPWVDELYLFFNSHLICSLCKTIKPDSEFHRSSAQSRRNRYTICKNCMKDKHNKNFTSFSKIKKNLMSLEESEYLAPMEED